MVKTLNVNIDQVENGFIKKTFDGQAATFTVYIDYETLITDLIQEMRETFGQHEAKPE